jgi:uncharacterized membrane protein YeaQ/YmgE (transglycosylase-associated protein family)
VNVHELNRCCLFRQQISEAVSRARLRLIARDAGDSPVMAVVLAVLAAIVILFVVAVLVIGLVVKLLWWALIGLVLGVLARAILPGEQKIGFLWTAGAGIAAAFLGGVIAHAAGVGNVLQFVIAAAVAVVIVAVVSAWERASA